MNLKKAGLNEITVDAKEITFNTLDTLCSPAAQFKKVLKQCKEADDQYFSDSLCRWGKAISIICQEYRVAVHTAFNELCNEMSAIANEVGNIAFYIDMTYVAKSCKATSEDRKASAAQLKQHETNLKTNFKNLNKNMHEAQKDALTNIKRLKAISKNKKIYADFTAKVEKERNALKTTNIT